MSRLERSVVASLLAACALCFTSCKSGSDSPPPLLTPEVSYVTFENHSTSNVTYDVVWDGSRVASLSPGWEHSIQTTPGGHTLTWKISNTGATACSGATPQLVKGKSYRFWCTY